MPKWSDRKSQAPLGGGIRPRSRPKREHPVVDIAAEEPKPDDQRLHRVNKPEVVDLTTPESLTIDPNPAPDGIRYEIINIGGTAEYLIVLHHGDEVFGCKATRHSGVVPVSDLGNKRGKWTGYLLADGQVASTVKFEMDLTVEWLAETLGAADILFADSDGMIDRLGAMRVTPYPKKKRTDLSGDREDVALCVVFPDLPDDMPNPRPKFALQIERPRSGGIYYQMESPIAHVAGFLFKLRGYLPGQEAGDWTVTVSLGSRVLGRTTMRIGESTYRGDLNHEEPVEEFAVNIVG